MLNEQLTYLLNRYKSGMLSQNEWKALYGYMQDIKAADLEQDLLPDWLITAPDAFVDEGRWQPMLQRIFQSDQLSSSTVRPPRITYLKTTWMRYAAAILIAITTIAYFTTSFFTRAPDIVRKISDPLKVIAPGGNKAVLTLADGSRIVLDSLADGNVAKQGHTAIVKTGEGELAYQLQTKAERASEGSNTLTTPIGGQYQLTLPDGSKAWLNAASSITFPTTFAGGDRKVKITGEVYFEVIHRAGQVFEVSTNERASVRVLGTRFNVNAYADEKSVITTLLDGAVQVSPVDPQAIRPVSSVVLRPGESAVIRPGSPLPTVAQLDTSQVIAWKNGLFHFENVPLTVVMRQLSRWYAISVVYEGVPPERRFSGKLPRSLTLQEVLTIMKKMKIRYRIENQQLYLKGE